MNSKAVVLFVVVCSLAFLVRQGFAMQCYNCINCNDPFDAKKYNSSRIDCTGSCTKLKAKDTVTRTCIQVLKSDNCEKEGDNAACQCTGNLCNSGLMTQSSICLTFIITAASLLRKYVL